MTSGAEERLAALGLCHLIGRHTFPVALPTGRFSAAQIWNSSDARLGALLKMGENGLERLCRIRSSFDAAAAFETLERSGVTMIVRGEPAYPACLLEMHDPPPAIFVKAESKDFITDMMSTRRVAIVGARRASDYGIDAATSLAAELSRLGVCVVSGLAFGIDAAAHRGSLRHAGGAAAVLGCGCDVVYPRAHARLYGEIIATGAIISEYPPGTEPLPWRFPARNRIIAGLSEGVVVVEAAEKSGALITADFCLEQGKEVWALPGEIFSELSVGPHRLIRSGASLATCAEDILTDLGEQPPFGQAQISLPQTKTVSSPAHCRSPLTSDEAKVMSVLGPRPFAIETLAELSRLSGQRAAAAIISLELKGLARHDAGRGYCR